MQLPQQKTDPAQPPLSTSSPGDPHLPWHQRTIIFNPILTSKSMLLAHRVNGEPAQPSCFMCSLLNTNNNNNNNVDSNTIANTEAATPDPYISMEIGNWRETLGVPAGSSSVEFSGSGKSRQAQPFYALYCFAFVFALLSWIKKWPINWLALEQKLWTDKTDHFTLSCKSCFCFCPYIWIFKQMHRFN